MSETNPEKKKQKLPEKKLKKYLRIFWALVIVPFLLIFLLVWMVSMEWFGKLPSTNELLNPQTNLATEIISSDGKILGKYYAENRVNVKYRDLSPSLVNGLIATEDARFYDHSGVDLRGLFRVLFRTVIGGEESSGGGSTLSQQLAKMLFPREKNQSKIKLVARKIKEWIIAARLEKQYTKEEILTMYINKFDFINLAVGIKSASKIYFNTTPDSLKTEQAAMLVGMCKNPALFNPQRRADTTLQRRNVVMAQMVKYGYLSEQKFDSLKKLPLGLNFQPEDHNLGIAPYFREYLRDDFMRKWIDENPKPDGTKYDVYRDGLKIYTTIDSRMQQYAERAMEEHMKEIQKSFFKECQKKKNPPFDFRLTNEEINGLMVSAMHRSDRYHNLKTAGMSEEEIKKDFNMPASMRVFSWNGEFDTTMTPWDSIRYYKHFLQAGLMSMDPHTGYIKAWVGGINYKHFKYDHVNRRATRQVGSTFKPFVYALAIMEGWSPCQKIPNVPVTFELPNQPPWTPQNSGEEEYNGKMVTMKFALALSINWVTAYIMKQFGPEPVVQFAQRLGITAPLEPVPSLCLGTADISVFEMTGAMSTFANKGTRVEPIFVTRIEDKNGRVLADFRPKTEEVMNEEKAYVSLSMLQGVVQNGTGSRLRYKYKLMNPLAGKTGTTQNHSDGWFMGITPDLVTGTWVGGEDRGIHFSNMTEGQGASMALPIFAYYMQKVYADKKINLYQGDFEKPAGKINVEMDCDKYNKEMEQGGGQEGDKTEDENF
ncbi:MAG: transglycosylase domain-containing protein [Bacteroidetes bacterium]|nr:transglycosylase domain-containing protein [Bacteroidota bacterium]